MRFSMNCTIMFGLDRVEFSNNNKKEFFFSIDSDNLTEYFSLERMGKARAGLSK